MEYTIELSDDIEGMEIITDEEYLEYTRVISLLDSENDSYFGSFDDWKITVKGFLRNLEFKKITEQELDTLRKFFGYGNTYGIHFYNKLDKLRNAYQPNDKDTHTYILSNILYDGGSYYRLYKKFELKVFEYNQDKKNKKYTTDCFTTNSEEVWTDEYRFNEFTNIQNDCVKAKYDFDDVNELVAFLIKNDICLY